MRPASAKQLVWTGVVLAGASMACGGGGGGGGGNSSTLDIVKTAGDNQTGTVGAALGTMLQVTVTEDGGPKQNATVNWTSTAAGASFAPSQSTTDAAGIAQTVWTLGTVSGAQTARGAIAGTGRTVSFTATANPGLPSGFTKQAGDNQAQQTNGVFSTPLSAKVADQFGNGVGGITVDWNVISGPVTLAGGGASAQSSTNTQGIATMAVTAGGTLGAAQVDATTAAVAGTTLSFTLTVAPAPLIVAVGNTFFQSNRNSSINPAVDTVVVGQAVRWDWVAGSHSVQSVGVPSFSSSAVQTGAAGTHQVTFTATGTYQYNCVVHGNLMTGRVFVQ